jgi:hypothetical protein
MIRFDAAANTCWSFMSITNLMVPMSTFSASPFISSQSILNLRKAFPDAEALGAAVRGGKRHGQEILARLWLTEGIPFAFQDNPSVYEEMRVLPRFCGHLIKAHNGPGGCHDTEAEIFSGVQA